MPRVSPAKVSRMMDTQDIEIPQAQPREMKGTGPAKEALAPETMNVEPAKRVDSEWAANMAFAHELITIRVDDSTDENAEKKVEVWNNGDLMIFPRGQEVTCQRRFVESLMRAKPTKYSQQAVIDEFGKVGGYKEIPHRALRYHFAVVRDESPHAQAWLKSTLAQA